MGGFSAYLSTREFLAMRFDTLNIAAFTPS